MVKLMKISLISAVLATGAMAAQNVSELPYAGRLIGDIEIASGTLKIQKDPNSTSKPCTFTYGKVTATDSAEITIPEGTIASEGDPANFYNGYRFEQTDSNTNTVEILGGFVDENITTAKDVKIQPLSVLRSFNHNRIAEVLPDYSDKKPIKVNLCETEDQPVFLISPTIEDQGIMTEFLGKKPKAQLVSENPDTEFNIVMQGSQTSDEANWKKASLSGEPFRDLKLSILQEVEGKATLMGKCDLTADQKMTIPTSFTSAEIADSLTNIGDAGVETDITIDVGKNKVTFTGELDFSSHGVKIKGEGGVIVCKNGIKI